MSHEKHARLFRTLSFKSRCQTRIKYDLSRGVSWEIRGVNKTRCDAGNPFVENEVTRRLSALPATWIAKINRCMGRCMEHTPRHTSHVHFPGATELRWLTLKSVVRRKTNLRWIKAERIEDTRPVRSEFRANDTLNKRGSYQDNYQ